MKIEYGMGFQDQGVGAHGSSNTPHYHIILSDPEANYDKVVVVNLTSTTMGKETNGCIINQNEWVVLRKTSFPKFSKVQVIDGALLSAKFDKGVFTQIESPPYELVEKITEALLISDYVEIGAIEIIESQDLA